MCVVVGGGVKTLSGTYKPTRYVSVFYVLSMCLAAEGKMEDNRMEAEGMEFSGGRMLHAEVISDVQGTAKMPVRPEQTARQE